MNEGIKKRNYIVYALACVAICIFLLFIYFYDRATDTRQQQSAYAVTEWTDYSKNMYMKKPLSRGRSPWMPLSAMCSLFTQSTRM